MRCKTYKDSQVCRELEVLIGSVLPLQFAHWHTRMNKIALPAYQSITLQVCLQDTPLTPVE